MNTNTITPDFVAEVRAHAAKSWHDQAWHSFNASPECEAVRYALGEASLDDSDEDICAEALSYIAAQQ